MKRFSALFLLLTLAGFSVSSSALADKSMMPGTNLTPTPAVQSAEGTILDIQQSPCQVKLKAADGKDWVLSFDPKITTVWQANRRTEFSKLKVGSRVRVRHVSKRSGEFAKSIEIEP